MNRNESIVTCSCGTSWWRCWFWGWAGQPASQWCVVMDKAPGDTLSSEPPSPRRPAPLWASSLDWTDRSPAGSDPDWCSLNERQGNRCLSPDSTDRNAASDRLKKETRRGFITGAFICSNFHQKNPAVALKKVFHSTKPSSSNTTFNSNAKTN